VENLKNSKINKIAVFTSGGDAPGMNAAIRAVVRACLYYGKTPFGIEQGYDGLISGQVMELSSRSVSNIIHRGGTILRSARSAEFRTKEGRKKAYENLQKNGIEGIVACGGDGTFTGASIFMQEYPDISIVGIPGTIDNDLNGTDYTIGYDTATKTAVEAIDKIRDTASSHNRLFFIEVMGRDSGQIALRSSIAAGVEAMLIPEIPLTTDELVAELERGSKNKKSSSLVVVAEGSEPGRSYRIAKEVTDKFNYYDTKVTILGHTQRGGSPTVNDRVLASRLGVAAVESLLSGEKGIMIGIINNKINFTPFEKAIKNVNNLDEEMVRIAKILSL
jgi:6-phosphofructokinase 1